MSARSLLAILMVTAGGVAAACSSSGRGRQAAPPRTSSTVESGATPSTVGGPGTTIAAPSCGPASAASSNGDGGGKETNPPGDIPDNQAFVVYRPPDGQYTVKVPEGWARTEQARSVSFTDKFNTVRVDVVDASQAPTVASERTTELPKLAASEACFHAGGISTVTRNAGTGVLITYQADGPPDPVTGKIVREDVERYEFWYKGVEAVITVSGAAGSDNVDPWRIVTDSFAWQLPARRSKP